MMHVHKSPGRVRLGAMADYATECCTGTQQLETSLVYLQGIRLPVNQSE